MYTLALLIGLAVANAERINLVTKVDLFASETGYYTFDGYQGVSPDITVNIGDTLVFDQRDITNYYHPLGFAFYPDGAHGATWGGDERDEVEGLDQIAYYIDGERACPDPTDIGLDCYEPRFFYPSEVWAENHYTVELTITQELADESLGGVLYYFCHIHSLMSGKIIIAGSTGKPGSTAPFLYTPYTPSAFDVKCGTSNLASYAAGGENECTEQFVCGELNTEFEQCLQAMDCAMNREMKVDSFDTHGDPIALFAQQMIPHHVNAINMAKLLMKQVPQKELEDSEFFAIVHDIIVTQNFQNHVMRAYLGGHESFDETASHEIHEKWHGPHCNGTAIDLNSQAKDTADDDDDDDYEERLVAAVVVLSIICLVLVIITAALAYMVFVRLAALHPAADDKAKAASSGTATQHTV